MAVSDLFEPRPDTSKTHNDTVGTFRSGEVKRGKPTTLQAFRVTCVDEDTAETISEELGGDVVEHDNDKEPLQVYTNATKVAVIFESIESGFKLWVNNEFVRSCNGQIQTGGDHAGERCPCADLTLQERKDSKGGCRPSIEVTFRIKSLPELGLFKFRSSSWSLLESVQGAERKVDEARDDDRKVSGHIAIEQVTTKIGRTLTLPRVVAQ